MKLGNRLSLGSRGVKGTTFTPANIANGYAWYQYDTGITIDGSNKVLSWDSQIVSGNQLTSTSGNQPTYSSGDIIFGNNFMDFTTWQPGSFSAYFVCKVTAGSISNEELLSFNSFNFMRIQNPTELRVRIGDSTNNNITFTNSLSVNTWMILGVEWLGSGDGTINIYQDTHYSTPSGSATDTGTLSGFDNLGARTSIPFDGDMREIIFINNELSSSDRNNLMTYLKDKHSI
tara:strand:- start:691 stop:1383 length:693 start_codon:yes stop_codon:yes gene_type:complete